MKPQLLKVQLRPGHSFSSRHDIVPVFYNKWHYHRELELVYILKGTGSLFIGYDIRHFKTGDLVLIGSNLPHMWGSEKKVQKKKGFNCESYVLHFLPDCFGQDFFYLPENKSIFSVLEKSERGILIKGKVREQIMKMIIELLNAESAERIVLLLRILDTIGRTKEQELICSQNINSTFKLQDSNRLNLIYQYIFNNFSQTIKLEEIAEVANLAPNSFCRYFKSRTRKSFSKFLIEVRINHACKLLVETPMSVAGICYDCGYNSFSNFNKHFRLITKKTPLAHRKYYLEKDNTN